MSFPRGLKEGVGVGVCAVVCERRIERERRSKRTRDVQVERIVVCVRECVDMGYIVGIVRNG